MSDLYTRIKRNFRIMREQNNLTEEELALKAGRSAKYIKDLESGEKNIKLLYVMNVCRILEINLLDFFQKDF